ARTELARGHVLDHALAQRRDGFRTHRQLLSWMRLTTPRSSRQDTPPATHDLHPGYRARRQAARLSGLLRSDLVHWHKADIQEPPINVRFRGKSGHPELCACPLARGRGRQWQRLVLLSQKVAREAR